MTPKAAPDTVTTVATGVAELIPAYAAVRGEVITHRPTFMLGIVDDLIWPSVRVENR